MQSFITKVLVASIFISAVFGIGIAAFPDRPQGVQEMLPLELAQNLVVQREVIGKSVEGREIAAYTYGNGENHLVFVGGIHGGYEWNTVVLAYEVMDYLQAHPAIVPDNLTVTVVPAANPDGVYEVTGKEGRFTVADVPLQEEFSGVGRFNARNVDLNRNFDCKWQPEGMWQWNTVSGGVGPFSEPETLALRSLFLERRPDAVIFWHSKANVVYASECEDGIRQETLDIMNLYAEAAGYLAFEAFDEYEITGDAEGWLASLDIPAISVELETHETVEWERNLAGIEALFRYYGSQAKSDR